jgi:hypothetical protein
MDVVVESTHWHVVVDDNSDILNIKTSGGDISGNEQLAALGLGDWLLELCVNLISFPLLLVSVNSFRLVFDCVLQIFVPMEVLLKLITRSLSFTEDDNFERLSFVVGNQFN